jgi:superfamily II DNA or RNA helicase
MKPRKYQQEAVDEIINTLQDSERVCYTLATGGGKTALFSFLTKQYIGNSNKRVLIMAHRTELIQQTVNTLFNIGMRSEAVIASKKYLNHSSQVYVAMVETISNRLKKNPYFLPNIDLIIVDECHLLFFEKIFVHFPKAKVLGVTATPATTITEKTIRVLADGSEMEYKQKFGLHKIYKKLIVGYGIENLINDGNLVPEMVFKDTQIKREGLSFDEKTNEFKQANNYAKKMCAVTNYEKFAKGKKTIIFTASTKENISLLQDFQEREYENVRIFDSVNKEESGSRSAVLKWFENTPDAILINTGVFTTGFDEPTIECVMLAMSTASLSKYHQMVGRGGRSTKKIFKDKFLLIDLGGNVDAFGKWSDPVDWADHFYLKSPLVPKKEALENITFCGECEMIIPATAAICPFCGHEKPPKKVSLTKETVHVAELIYPSGEKIVKYCQMYGKDKNFAVEILFSQCIDLFRYTEISLEKVESTIKNGNFFKTMKIVMNEQVLIIQNSNLQGEYKKNHLSEFIVKLYEFYNKK